jgi:hypothetical protein
VYVAQLDRALGYGPRCRGFESSHARKLKQVCFKKANLFFYSNTVTYEQPFYNSKSPGKHFLTNGTAYNEILIVICSEALPSVRKSLPGIIYNLAARI